MTATDTDKPHSEMSNDSTTQPENVVKPRLEEFEQALAGARQMISEMPASTQVLFKGTFRAR